MTGAPAESNILSGTPPSSTLSAAVGKSGGMAEGAPHTVFSLS